MKLNNVEEAISAFQNYIKYSSQNDEIVLQVKKLIQDLEERRLE